MSAPAGAPVFFPSSAAGSSPFVGGVVLANEGGERVRIQPDAGGAPIDVPTASVFLRSPAVEGPQPSADRTVPDASVKPRRDGPRTARTHTERRRTTPRYQLSARAGGVADNAQLFYLDEANLLSNLDVRYAHDAIYTYTGTVLLALNPYKSIEGLYSTESMEAYRGRALGVLPPHVYAIAEVRASP